MYMKSVLMEIGTLDPDLNIALEGFATKDDANCLGNNALLAAKVLAEHHELDISKLKKVVITYDFASALQKVTSEYNHRLPSSFTNSKQSTAIGQLVSKIGSDGLCIEYTLVLSVNFFVEWFNEDGTVAVDKDRLPPVLHRLHHELVHVHEKNTLTCLDQGLRVNAYDEALLLSATRAWSEYLANFMSSPSAPKETIDCFLENFQTVLNEVPSEIDSFVWNYMNRKISLDAMFFEVKQRVKLIVNSYAYAIGYVHAININLQEYLPNLANAISNSKLKHSLADLSNALESLTERYKNNKLDDYEDFSDVSAAIDSIFKAFGLTLEHTDGANGSDLYIHVSWCDAVDYL